MVFLVLHEVFTEEEWKANGAGAIPRLDNSVPMKFRRRTLDELADMICGIESKHISAGAVVILNSPGILYPKLSTLAARSALPASILR